MLASMYVYTMGTQKFTKYMKKYSLKKESHKNVINVFE